LDLSVLIRKDAAVKSERMERWHRVRADIRGARFSPALVILLCLVQGVVALLGQRNWIYETFGLSRTGILEGKIWQILTHSLLHGHWWIYAWHLILNSVALLVAGAKLERIGGGGVFVRVFASGVAAGGVFQLVATPDPGQILIGASGGIFALVFWLLAVHSGKRMWPIPVSGRSLAYGILLAEAGLAVVAWLLPDSAFAAIGSGCHLGGGVAGWWLGRRCLGPSITKEQLLLRRRRQEARGETALRRTSKKGPPRSADGP
jgi:membrane associated rhomboid family serine protease